MTTNDGNMNVLAAGGHGVSLRQPASAGQQHVDAARQALPPPLPVPEGEPREDLQLPQAAGPELRGDGLLRAADPGHVRHPGEARESPQDRRE